MVRFITAIHEFVLSLISAFELTQKVPLLLPSLNERCKRTLPLRANIRVQCHTGTRPRIVREEAMQITDRRGRHVNFRNRDEIAEVERIWFVVGGRSLV